MTDLVTTPRRASFTSMREGTAEDWGIIRAADREMPVADELLEQLEKLGRVPGGFAVDRLTHSLQTATRAEQAGRSDLYVLAALLHDIGDSLAPANHSALAAAALQPHLSEDLHWMVLHHGEFQLSYFGQFVGVDPNLKEQYRGHRWFDLTEEFCEEFDQNSFDPAFATKPFDHFVPLVRALIS
jgi:predicted HD phosphohydrolase